MQDLSKVILKVISVTDRVQTGNLDVGHDWEMESENFPPLDEGNIRQPWSNL
jgi:hypothetical protein